MYFLMLNFIRDQKIVSFSNGIKRKLFCEDIKLFTEESIKLLFKPQRKKKVLWKGRHIIVTNTLLTKSQNQIYKVLLDISAIIS